MLSGTKDAVFLYRRFLETDSHLASNPFTALFPASSSNFDHKVYVYVYIYIQAWTDITEPRHLRIHVYVPLLHTGLGRIGSLTTSHTGGNTNDFHGLVVRAKCVVHELAEGENSARGQRRDITRTDDRRAETPWKRGAPATLR